MLVVGALAWWRHDEFLSHRFDLGNMVQAVWSTAQGRPLELTDSVTGEQIVRLGAHVDPILVLLAPLWWAYPSPHALILAQVVALAAGVYPVVRLGLNARDRSSPRLSLRPGTSRFRGWCGTPSTMFIPSRSRSLFLLYAIWALDEQRLGLFTVFAALALLTGELVGLTVAALGIWYAVRYRRATGLAIAGGGVLWTAVCLAIVCRRSTRVRGAPSMAVRDGWWIAATDSRDAFHGPWSHPRCNHDRRGPEVLGTASHSDRLPGARSASHPHRGRATAGSQRDVGFLVDEQPMFQYVAPVIPPLVAARSSRGRPPRAASVGRRRRSLLESSSWPSLHPCRAGLVSGQRRSGADRCDAGGRPLVPSGEP